MHFPNFSSAAVLLLHITSCLAQVPIAAPIGCCNVNIENTITRSTGYTASCCQYLGRVGDNRCTTLDRSLFPKFTACCTDNGRRPGAVDCHFLPLLSPRPSSIQSENCLSKGVSSFECSYDRDEMTGKREKYASIDRLNITKLSVRMLTCLPNCDWDCACWLLEAENLEYISLCFVWLGSYQRHEIYLRLRKWRLILQKSARLMENPEVTVAVMEDGADRMDDPQVSTPAAYSTLLGREKYDWCITSVEQPTAGGKTYSMPNENSWEIHLHQTLDVAKMSPKDPKFMPNTAKEKVHGNSGPIHTSFNDYYAPIEEDFVKACYEVGDCENTLTDAWSGDHLGFYSSLATVDRSHDVLTEALATKIILDGNTANGVEFTHAGETYKVGATKEVICSAGTTQTPQILELSGIGDPAVLEKVGVKCLVENKRVGSNFQHHALGGMMRSMENPGKACIRALIPPLPISRRSVFPPPSTSPLAQTRQNCLQNPPRTKTCLELFIYLEQPRSHGTVHIQSSNPTEAPRIIPAISRHPVDAKIMAAGTRWLDQIANRPILASQLGQRLLPAEGKSLETEERLNYVRNHVPTQYHIIGTANMIQEEVVDDHLRVHG
ncbi:GMC oxidoreductase [Venturia nashicola]|nr:GMC oxidoreductase [Venturia nashicola]